MRVNRDTTKIINWCVNRPVFVDAQELKPGNFTVVRPKEVFDVQRPKAFNDVQWRIFQSAMNPTIPEARVLDAPNIFLWGYDSWLFTDEGRSVVGLWDPQGAMSERERITMQGRPSDAIRSGAENLSGTSLLLNQVVGGNYYHFVYQIMTRLALAADVLPLQEIDHFIVPPNVTGFMRDWLALEGIFEDRIRPMRPETGISCERLIATSNPGPYNLAPKWSIDYLRSTVPDSATRPVPKRIFLSRRDAPARKLINHSEIHTLLEKYGFEYVLPGDRTVVEQAALFRHAETIVAVHGAALANLVFANRDLQLIELLPNNHIQPTFWTLSQQLGIQHDIVVGDEQPLPFDRLRRNTKADLTIAPAALEMVLRERGLGHV